MLGDQLANFRDKVLRNLDEGSRRITARRFIFSDCFVFRLRFVVIEDALDALLVPPRRELTLLHGAILRLRRRYANAGFPRTSKAVITKMSCGSESET